MKKGNGTSRRRRHSALVWVIVSCRTVGDRCTNSKSSGSHCRSCRTEFGTLFLQTLAWSAALKHEGIIVPTPRLIGIRLASQAMGYLTVFGLFFRAMKINLLRTPVESHPTATFLDNECMVYVRNHRYCGLPVHRLGEVTRRSSVFVLSAVFALIMVFAARRKPLLASLTGVLGKRSPSWLNKGAD